MKEILKRNYQDVVKDTFMVKTRSQTKSKGVTTRDMVRPPNKKGTRKKVKSVVIDNSPIVIDLRYKARSRFTYSKCSSDSNMTQLGQK